MAHAPHVQVRRVYDLPEADDGQRVLVDRLWPRGLSKERAHLDEWCKEVAPSTELREWYDHDPNRYEEFACRYRAELDDPERAAAFARLREMAAHGPLTLLTAAKRSDISEATVLAGLLTNSSSRLVFERLRVRVGRGRRRDLAEFRTTEPVPGFLGGCRGRMPKANAAWQACSGIRSDGHAALRADNVPC